MKNRLKVLRAERDWSQGHLAELLDVSRQTINALETGKYDPSLPEGIEQVCPAWVEPRQGWKMVCPKYLLFLAIRSKLCWSIFHENNMIWVWIFSQYSGK